MYNVETAEASKAARKTATALMSVNGQLRSEMSGPLKQRIRELRLSIPERLGWLFSNSNLRRVIECFMLLGYVVREGLLVRNLSA